MRAKTLWRLCAFTGLCVAIFSFILLPMFPETGAVDLSGYGGPVFAFEVAQSQTDLQAIFGSLDDPARAARVRRMNTGNYWDFGFMALYSLFGAFFFAAIFAKSKRKIWLVFAAFGLLSGVMDAWENVMLLEISANLLDPPYLDTLPIAVWSKFFAIAAGIVGAGVFLLSRPKLILKIYGAAALIGAISVPVAFSNPAEYGWLLQKGIAASWILMSLYAYARCVDKLE